MTHFGLAHFVDEEMNSILTDTYDDELKVRWVAPEIFEGRKFTSASDVWAFGMVIYVSTRFSLPGLRLI